MSAVASKARGVFAVSSAPWFTSLVTVILLVAMLGIGGAAYPSASGAYAVLAFLRAGVPRWRWPSPRRRAAAPGAGCC